MAYGVNASVTFLVGGLQDTNIDSNNIDTAISMADVYVDQINSSASSDVKTQASNEIAANIVMWAQSNSELRGLKAVGPTNNVEAISGELEREFVTDSIKKFLIGGSSGSKVSARFEGQTKLSVG
jgi:hypothetical protein